MSRRVRVRCRGAVQGVGFRPAVHRLALGLKLGGWVLNDGDGATTEVEGTPDAIDAFLERLPNSLPPLARLDDFEVMDLEEVGDKGFAVRSSAVGPRSRALVPPDAALCRACRKELADPRDRRHNYPFTTCTDCGPRFSIVRRLPFDRDRTVMDRFPLCASCAHEYDDADDRRFHAEALCCPECGPRLWLATASGEVKAEAHEAIHAARQALLEGSILAVKGLGGFQLACRADDNEIVDRLRDRKRRRTKPFAVMLRDAAAARALVRLSEADERLLASPRAPVVLAPRVVPSSLARGVAPGIEDLGVLLPTTPLHVELFRDHRMPPLVMTSGNISEEPICRSNRKARSILDAVADLFLLHDRGIVRRVDDSVVRSADDGPVVVRRARGWVPEPLALPEATPEPVLAVGGHLQNTVCLATGRQAFMSQHVGDLDSEATRRFHREVIGGLEDFLEVVPSVLIGDCHPDYPSTWLARERVAERGGRFIAVQHHLAHAAAVLGEHQRFPEPDEKVLAVMLDGTGWGPDDTAWGGEWLTLTGKLEWQRVGQLETLPLVGGERAVREPWRVAAAALARTDSLNLLLESPLQDLIGEERLRECTALAESGTWPLASGAGRLFEAGGALLGLTAENDWEGEAAVRLESAASEASEIPIWRDLALGSFNDRPILPSAEILTRAARLLVDGQPPATIAAGLHETFCVLAAELCRQVADDSITTVALSGGCLVNRLLRSGLRRRLEALDFEVLMPAAVPPGDGGLSYGQAVLASISLARGLCPVTSGSPEMPG